MEKQEIRELIEHVNSLDDMKKLVWLRDNQDMNIVVNLDSDSATATFEDIEDVEDIDWYDEDSDNFIIQFDEPFGWKSGIINLFELLEIRAQVV